MMNRHKRHLKGLRYGRTKPGTLLKHQIPIQTEHWRVTEPGFTEVDLVAHCGEHASGEFVYSLNLTDIHSGWVRYDSADAAAAMNDLYRHELSWMMNLFQPSVKLKKKERVGSRLHREYDVPKTPLQRLVDDFHTRNEPVSESVQSMTGRIDSIDPFDLSDTIDQKLSRIECIQRKPVRQPVSESEPASIHSAPRGAMNGTL